MEKLIKITSPIVFAIASSAIIFELLHAFQPTGGIEQGIVILVITFVLALVLGIFLVRYLEKNKNLKVVAIILGTSLAPLILFYLEISHYVDTDPYRSIIILALMGLGGLVGYGLFRLRSAK